MISSLAIITLVSFAYGANYPITDSNNQYGWIQDWSLTDEFWNQNTLNSAKWYDYNPNWLGRQPGLFDPDNIEVKDNKLYMHANIDWNIAQVYKDKGYYKYTTSAVTAKKSLLYGYVEIKAKVGGSRVSSAFWLSNDDRGGVGTWTEIDIFEQAGTVGTSWNDYHVLHSNTHVFALSGTSAWNLASKCGCTGTSDCKDPDWWSKDSINSFSDDYHIYGLWWTSSFIKMYVDGELIRTTTNKCFHQELYLKFDRETFPNWFGLPETWHLPDDPFIIEYVRTWKQGSSFTEEDEAAGDGLSGAETAIVVIGCLLVCACIGIGVFCLVKRKRKMKNETVKLEKDEVETPVGDNGEYDMSPVVASESNGDTPKTNTAANEEDPEIEIDLEIEQEQETES